MTRHEATAAAERAAEAVRELNHQTRPRASEMNVVDVYDLLGELALLASRLPQLLRQVEDLLDDLVEHDQVRVVDGVDGDQQGDPVAVAAVTGHWLTTAAGAAHELAHRVDHAHQNLTWAAPASS